MPGPPIRGYGRYVRPGAQDGRLWSGAFGPPADQQCVVRRGATPECWLLRLSYRMADLGGTNAAVTTLERRGNRHAGFAENEDSDDEGKHEPVPGRRPDNDRPQPARRTFR
jgi:hypothetical protein